MIDALILLSAAAIGWIGWLVGMMKKRAQFWVRFFGPIGLAYLGWYYLFVLLPRVEPAILAGNMQIGHWTIGFIVGGIWALLANPKPERPDSDGGAQSA